MLAAADEQRACRANAPLYMNFRSRNGADRSCPVMKKLFLLLALVFTVHSASAQELGIRVGDVLGNYVAVDGLVTLGEFSRVHADLSFGKNGVGIEALYDFLYRPLGFEAFNWYVGAGPSMFIGDPFYLGFSGEVGVDYHFVEVPLTLSLDWRPTFWLIEETTILAGGFGLNVRYVFGQ
jgi:hypothetical protein